MCVFSYESCSLLYNKYVNTMFSTIYLIRSTRNDKLLTVFNVAPPVDRSTNIPPVGCIIVIIQCVVYVVSVSNNQ